MISIFDFEKKRISFTDPLEIISCHEHSGIPECFERIEKALQRGYYLAGFLSYESGFAFEECLRNSRNHDFPLIYMGVFRQPKTHPLLHSVQLPPLFIREGDHGGELSDPLINISLSQYYKNIETIKYHISIGDVYQITYCIKYKFDFPGDTYSLYQKLLKEQPVPYPAYIKTNDFDIVSLSPELFVKKNNSFVTTKPMKGTWHRGRNFIDDILAGWKLKFDPKNRAENIMIADLLRNDLGRIGRSIKWPKIFEVARYTTLFQMTSTVTGNVDINIPVYEIFRALFPSGSVTGAPKIRAMQVINEIEKEERRIYTGAIGYITPERDMIFNVPIRTLLIRDGRGEVGIGGGIVWDSTPQAEFDECMLKARFLLH
jgi:para-aminobenzoate synthetase/4-amino-4-deoxychorismate lyase